MRYSANAEQELIPAVNSTGQTKDERKEKRKKGKGKGKFFQQKTVNRKAMAKGGGETRTPASKS